MKKYIKAANLPPSFSLTSLAVVCLLAERFSAPGWAYGVIGTVYALNAISVVIRLAMHSAVDIFEGK